MATILHLHAHDLAKACSTALRCAHRDPRPANIHALRVSMKRMRTLLRLAEHMVPDAAPPGGATRRFTALFRSAGLVREARVSRTVLAAMPCGTAVADALAARLRRGERRAAGLFTKAIRNIRRKDLVRLADHLTAVGVRFTHSQERKALLRYVDHELRAAKALLRKPPDAERLHEVRKHLKNAWHTLRLLARNGGLDPARKALMAALGEVQEALGGHHDLHVLFLEVERWKADDAGARRLRRTLNARMKLAERRVLREVGSLLKPRPNGR